MTSSCEGMEGLRPSIASGLEPQHLENANSDPDQARGESRLILLSMSIERQDQLRTEVQRIHWTTFPPAAES